MKTYNFEVKYTVNAEFFCNLLASALEGGSSYWVRLLTCKRPDDLSDVPTFFQEFSHICSAFGNGYIELAEVDAYVEWRDRVDENEDWGEGDEEYDGPKLILNEEALKRGFRVMQEKFPNHFSDAITEDGDATTADVFLQCCLLGDLIYG